MFCCSIELRPDGNHHPPVHGMNRIDHRFRVRETGLVKFVASPRVLRPMVPVEHDVVDRNPALTETLQRTEHLCLRIVFFTTLPISHRPLRHNLRLAGQRAVTADDIIHIIARHKIIVQLPGHFAPPRLLAQLFRSDWRKHTQTGIRNGPVGNPLHPQRHTLACFQIYRELITVWIPCSTPTFGHNRLAVYIYLCISRIIKDEIENSALRRFDDPLIGYFRAIEGKLLWQIHHLGHVFTAQMLKVQGILTTHQSLCTRFSRRNVGTCNRTLLTVLVIQLEHLTQLRIIVRIPETTKRITVKQHAIVFV